MLIGNEVHDKAHKISYQTGGLEDQRDGDNFPSKILVGAMTPYRKGISFSYADTEVFIRKGNHRLQKNPQ